MISLDDSHLNYYDSDPVKFLDKADEDSLKNLAAIKETGRLCFNVDTYGHVGEPYAEGTKASILRSAMWLTGISGNSNDIPKIKLLFDRTIWAYYCVGEDNSLWLSKALDGLKLLQSKYTVDNKKEVAWRIKDIRNYGTKILELIGKGERLHLNKTPDTFKEKLIACKSCENESYGQDSSTTKKVLLAADMGFFWYILKLDAFSRIHDLSEGDRVFIDNCIRVLNHGLKVCQAANLKNFLKKNETVATHNKLVKFSKNETVTSSNLVKPSKNWTIVTRNKLVKRSKKAMGKALDKAHAELADTQIGMAIPVTFFMKRDKDFSGRDGHTTILGIRKTEQREYFITQYNIGCGALGAISEKDVQSAVVFGPYSKQELYKRICEAALLHSGTFADRREGVKAFHNLFDSDREVPHGRPLRRMQVTGNCTFAGINEWLLDICQIHKKVDLYNKIYMFAQTRTKKEPPFVLGKEGIWDADKVYGLDFAEDDDWLAVTLPEKETKESKFDD